MLERHPQVLRDSKCMLGAAVLLEEVTFHSLPPFAHYWLLWDQPVLWFPVLVWQMSSLNKDQHGQIQRGVFVLALT